MLLNTSKSQMGTVEILNLIYPPERFGYGGQSLQRLSNCALDVTVHKYVQKHRCTLYSRLVIDDRLVSLVVSLSISY